MKNTSMTTVTTLNYLGNDIQQVHSCQIMITNLKEPNYDWQVNYNSNVYLLYIHLHGMPAEFKYMYCKRGYFRENGTQTLNVGVIFVIPVQFTLQYCITRNIRWYFLSRFRVCKRLCVD